MFELGQPAWLSGLLLLPVVYWLHKRALPVQAQPVSAAFLWPGEHPDRFEQQRAQTVDRRWLLRAAVVALLVIALAGPQWTGAPSRHIVVWFDNGPSMQTLENTVSRRQRALNELVNALQQTGADRIVVRTLQNPERRLELHAASAATPSELQAWLETPGRATNLPDPRVYAEGGESWLVTDAVHPGLARWIEQSVPTRVIAVGRETRNTAITRLSLRAQPGSRDKYIGLVGVAQHGGTPDAVAVTIDHDGAPVATLQLQLTPDRESMATFLLSGPITQPLRAVVATTDALTLDDALTVDATPLRPLATFITAACPPHIFKALAKHPAIAPVTTATGSAFTVACAATAPDSTGPTLWLATGPDHRPVAGGLRWQAVASPLTELVLDDLPLEQSVVPVPPEEIPLLLSGNRPLISMRFGPHARVAVTLDVMSNAWAHRPELPILLAGLVDTLFGQPLLERYAQASIPFTATRIAPQPLPPFPAPVETPHPGASHRDLTPYVIAFAILLLLADSQWRRLGGASSRRTSGLSGVPRHA